MSDAVIKAMSRAIDPEAWSEDNPNREVLAKRRHISSRQASRAYLAGKETMRAAVEAEVREECAKWHVQQRQGGHCGESTTEIILRQQRNEWHARAADAIRSNRK